MKSFDSITIIAALIIGSILITFLHEIGHAVTASLLTKKKADIYIGSYGEDGKYIRFSIWHINFNISYKFWKHYGGLCITKADTITINQQIAYILAGPILPVIISAAFVWSTQILDINEYVIANSYVVLILSVISMIYNFIPKENTEIIYNGLTIHNDGYQLKELFKYKTQYRQYIAAVNLYNEAKYKEASEKFYDFIKKGITSEMTYRLAISSFIMSENLKTVESLYNDFQKYFTPEAEDLINMAIYYSKTGEEDKSIEFYEQSLNLKETWHALNNIGYAFNLKGNYSEAINYFDRAMLIDQHAYTFNNRGLAKIKLGLTNEGLEDLEHGHTLDPTNSYYFKNMGIYYSDSKEYSKALAFFEKAKEMDSDTHQIDEDILRTRNILENHVQ